MSILSRVQNICDVLMMRSICTFQAIIIVKLTNILVIIVVSVVP